MALADQQKAAQLKEVVDLMLRWKAEVKEGQVGVSWREQLSSIREATKKRGFGGTITIFLYLFLQLVVGTYHKQHCNVLTTTSAVLAAVLLV